MTKHAKLGHLLALISVVVWGTTFISTKVLLSSFQPAEILFLRFVMAFFALTIIYPHRMGKTSLRQELVFAGAGLCGVCLYYLMENIALTYTLASNVSVIISSAPLFTAILIHLFTRDEDSIRLGFIIGFIAAMTGIFLISFNGSAMKVSPVGDFLSLGAAFVWGCYSLLTRRIGTYGFHIIQTTRRIFFYGILFMIPALYFLGFSPDLRLLIQPVNLCNLLFLGLGASAACFVTWNSAVSRLGALKTSLYIYMTPVVTVITSILVLHESITKRAAAGIALTLAGLVISEYRPAAKKETLSEKAVQEL